jgi:hypothetical protein
MSRTRLLGVLDEYGSLDEYRRDVLATRDEVSAQISAAADGELRARLNDRLMSLDLDLEWAAQQRAD